jgi:hemerythrin-like domain-containing protein
MPSNTLDMLLVHRVFRRQFRDMPELVDGVVTGDLQRARVVADHLTFMLSALHHHHAAEDELIWPKLMSRVSGREADLQRMVQDHNGIATAVHHIESLLPGWRRSADPALGRPLTDALAELSTQVDAHLDAEERIALPIIEEHLTRKEWTMVTRRGAAFLSAHNLRRGIALGWYVLEGSTPDERRVFLSGVPLPQRLSIRLFGARTAAAYDRELHEKP